MTTEQWGIRVPVKEGEEKRRELLHNGTLDNTLKIRHDENFLIFPITSKNSDSTRYLFEEQPNRTDIPRHETIGGIAIMQEDDCEGAVSILASRPSLHTVLFPTSEVTGEFRTREYKVLAGKPTTRTEVVEHGHRFVIDLSTAYFSARLSTERQRIAEKVSREETVLDMFAGVGPFAIVIACRAALVMAADLNPRAIHLMLENIKRNKVSNVLPILADASHLRSLHLGKFDRIIMNLPLAGTMFLPDAFQLVQSGGTIHFYSLVSQEGEHLERIYQLGGKEVTERIVRSYSPGQWHAVYDITT